MCVARFHLLAHASGFDVSARQWKALCHGSTLLWQMVQAASVPVIGWLMSWLASHCQDVSTANHNCWRFCIIDNDIPE